MSRVHWGHVSSILIEGPLGEISRRKSSLAVRPANPAQHLVAGGDKRIGMVFREAQRRTNFQRVAVGAGRAHENASVTKPVDEQARDLRRRLLGIAITNKFETDEQSGPADIADLDVAIADLAQPIHQVTADGLRI